LYYIDSLQLKGFRNYRQLKVNFHPRLNLVVGNNAQGKTSLLEAIYYLSVTRSFRTGKDHELANREDGYFFLKGRFIKDDFKNDIQVSYRSKGQLKVVINNNSANRYDHLQQFPVVVFSPDDLNLIREGPSTRRRFLNLEASRLSPVYFKELRAYQRALLQRNHLLKNNRNSGNIDNLLEPWNKALADLGSSIIHFRVELIQSLEKETRQFFNLMTSAREQLSLDYISSIDFSEGLQETKRNFIKLLAAKKDQELKKGSTAVGPHLDDLKISINNYDTRYYSSQGQKRTATLALKMAEVILFGQKHNESPIILLDDVFSEFDSDRKRHLLEFLNLKAGQCFITTAADSGSLSDFLQCDYKVLTVHQGSVRIEETGNSN
jgi:DNA replication and repair protein RecF